MTEIPPPASTWPAEAARVPALDKLHGCYTIDHSRYDRGALALDADPRRRSAAGDDTPDGLGLLWEQLRNPRGLRGGRAAPRTGASLASLSLYAAGNPAVTWSWLHLGSTFGTLCCRASRTWPSSRSRLTSLLRPSWCRLPAQSRERSRPPRPFAVTCSRTNPPAALKQCSSRERRAAADAARERPSPAAVPRTSRRNLTHGGRSEATRAGDGTRHGVRSAARPGYLCSTAAMASASVR